MKNKIQNSNLINFFILFISNIFLINCYVCSDFHDCFNCTMCGDQDIKYCSCEWDNYDDICYEKQSKKLAEWYNELTVCKNNRDQELFCSGEDTIYSKDDLDSDNSIKFQIKNKGSGKYGKRMLFCFYYYVDKESNDYLINVEFAKSLSIKPKLAYICHSVNETEEKIESIDSNKEITCTNVKKIFFMALLNREYTLSPFSIKLSLKNSETSSAIKNFIIVFAVLTFITSVGCFIFRFHYQKTRRKRRLIMFQRARENMTRIEQEINDMNNNNNSNSVDNENIEETNKQKLDELFSRQMAEHLYKSEYNEFGGGCSICLENFKKKSKVSITPCKHVFHYTCIKDWLYKNALNPKCPNCNKEVLVKDDNGRTDETKIIKVKKNKNNNNNNNNNNINFVGRNNINIRNITINSGIINNNTGMRENSSQSRRPQLGDY